MNKYEIIYIVKPTVEEDSLKALIEKFKGIVEKGGEIESIDEWGKRKLAYEINDFTEGYYVFMNFKANSEIPKELDRVLNINEDVIRHLIVKKED